MPGVTREANLMLAFENRGGWRDVRGAVIMTVLNQLLGGGSSFSSGGWDGGEWWNGLGVWGGCMLGPVVMAVLMDG